MKKIILFIIVAIALLTVVSLFFGINRKKVSDTTDLELHLPGDPGYVESIPPRKSEVEFIVNFLNHIERRIRFTAEQENEYFLLFGGDPGMELYEGLKLGRKLYKGNQYFELFEPVEFSPLGDLLIDKLEPLINNYTDIYIIPGDEAFYVNGEKIKLSNSLSRTATVIFIADKRYQTPAAILTLPIFDLSKNGVTAFQINIKHATINGTSMLDLLGITNLVTSDESINRLKEQRAAAKDDPILPRIE